MISKYEVLYVSLLTTGGSLWPIYRIYTLGDIPLAVGFVLAFSYPLCMIWSIAWEMRNE